MHDGITCYMSQCMCYPTLNQAATIPMKEMAVMRHASDTIHVVGLAMGESYGDPPTFAFRLSLYDSNMTLLKQLDTYDYSWRASVKDTHIHPVYLPGPVIVRSDVVLLTFAYFNDGPIDVVGDYYLGWSMYSVSRGDESLHAEPLNLMYEVHDAPYQMDSMVWRYRLLGNPSVWLDSTTRGMSMIFPIITPPCDTIAWASAAMEGDSVVRVQWDSTVDEVQVCLMPMGETPDSTGVFVKDTAAFDTMVVSGDYDVYVRRVCNERYLVCSDWTGPMTMLAPCEAPEMVLTADNDSCMTATWGGTRRPCEVSLVAAGEEPGEPELCVGHEWSRCGLDPTGAYEMYIRLVCDTLGGRSAWGGPYRLTMPRYGIEGAEGLADGIRLSPNPATATVRLTVEGLQGEATVRVTDAAGREAARYALHGTWLDIDVSRLPKGAYTVSVTTSEGTAARRLVVQ